jgi:hypothetical protein
MLTINHPKFLHPLSTGMRQNGTGESRRAVRVRADILSGVHVAVAFALLGAWAPISKGDYSLQCAPCLSLDIVHSIGVCGPRPNTQDV